MARHSQRFLFVATAVYLVLGLGAGLAYRELTKHADLPAGQPLQLGVLHTHLLTLGFVVGLIALVLDRVYRLGARRLFPVFFWVYNAGLLLSTAMMAVHGGIELGGGTVTAAVSGVAGMGHVVLTIGLGVFVVMLGQAVWAARAVEAEPVPEQVRA